MFLLIVLFGHPIFLNTFSCFVSLLFLNFNLLLILIRFCLFFQSFSTPISSPFVLLKWIFTNVYLIFIGPCIIAIVEEWNTNLLSLAILFHFLCAQHVSHINISITRSLQLCCWITTSVVLFSVRCVLEIWCGCKNNENFFLSTKKFINLLVKQEGTNQLFVTL